MTSLSRISDAQKHLIITDPAQTKKFCEAKEGLECLAQHLYHEIGSDHKMKETYENRLKKCNVKIESPVTTSSFFSLSSLVSRFLSFFGSYSPLITLRQRVLKRLSPNLSFTSLVMSKMFGRLDARTSYINERIEPTIRKVKAILEGNLLSDISLRIPTDNPTVFKYLKAFKQELSQSLTILKLTKDYIKDPSTSKKQWDDSISAFNCSLLEALVGMNHDKDANNSADHIGNSHRVGLLEVIPSE